MTCGEPFGPALFLPLSCRGGGLDDMRGTIWSRTFFYLCHAEAAGPMICREPFGPALFYLCHAEAAGPMTCEDKLWSSARFCYL